LITLRSASIIAFVASYAVVVVYRHRLIATEPHFDREIIILCVRWYLRFKQSLRDLVEMMAAERGLSLAHTTIMRWVRHYTPEFEKRWRRYALGFGQSWRVDETYVKINARGVIYIEPLIGRVVPSTSG
jgi:transposase-like protein